MRLLSSWRYWRWKRRQRRRWLKLTPAQRAEIHAHKNRFERNFFYGPGK